MNTSFLEVTIAGGAGSGVVEPFPGALTEEILNRHAPSDPAPRWLREDCIQPTSMMLISKHICVV